MAAEHEVVQHGHALEQGDVLECARYAECRDTARGGLREVVAIDGDAAGIRMVEAADQVEQRGLAGPVGTDHGQHLAAQHVQADARDSLHPTELLGHALDAQLDLSGVAGAFAHASDLPALRGFAPLHDSAPSGSVTRDSPAWSLLLSCLRRSATSEPGSPLPVLDGSRQPLTRAYRDLNPSPAPPSRAAARQPAWYG